MEEDHTFVASGDSCPVCMSLDGSTVPAGYTAHDNCLCRTVPKAKDLRCQSVSDNIDFEPDIMRSGHIIASFEVTVECPLGGYASASGYTDIDPSENPIEELWDAVGQLADDLCDSCDDTPDDFRCC